MADDRLEKAFFRQFFLNLPEQWQEGLLTAIEGGAFRGDICEKTDGPPSCMILFLAPEFVKPVWDLVEALMEAKRVSMQEPP